MLHIMLQYQCLVMYFWKKCLSWKTQIKVYFDFQLFFVDWFWQTIPQMNGVGQISTTTKNMWVILLFWHHLWYVTDDVTNVRGLKMNMFWNPLIKTAKLRYWLSKSVGNVLFNDFFYLYDVKIHLSVGEPKANIFGPWMIRLPYIVDFSISPIG